MKTFCILLCLTLLVNGDIYMHNPRGSNNRLDEEGRERRNANRMFDSQNNNRGGYNVGSLYYYEGSKLNIEWTNQHSCNSPNAHCEIVIQYICGDNIRDGATTTTIPENPLQCENYDCNTDTRYGMHEDYHYYLDCKLRERNKGLFTADQNLPNNRNRAKNTRQNPGGTRRAYECPEERDYYPYWHPTPWKDIAILTNDATRCEYYQKESENVKARFACKIPTNVLVENEKKGLVIPNNQADCDAFRWPKNDANGTRGVWTEVKAHNIAAPECRETDFSRDNHLGNGEGGYPNLFNWTIPNLREERCAMRIRYNISTEDYDPWNTTSALNAPNRNQPTKLDLSAKYGLADEAAAKDRGYVFENNPEVEIFAEVGKLEYRLALNTAQYGRTFQDRSFTFAMRRKPRSIGNAVVHNVNVRGKRGNIVQVYPAVEYDFVPNTLEMKQGDFVHFQWTGSNTNPNNNDGQGRRGTDRSNVVLQRAQVYPEGTPGVSAYGDAGKFGHWGRSYPELVSRSTLLGFSEADMMNLALLTPSQFGGEMSELDDAGTYFDLGPRKVTAAGTYHYLSTRNNNFSNRSQKGKIVVKNVEFAEEPIGWRGGNLVLRNGKAEVQVEQGAFTGLQRMRLEEWTADQGSDLLKEKNAVAPGGGNIASSFIVIEPQSQLTEADKGMKVRMNVQTSGTAETIIYRSTSDFNSWEKVDAQIEGDVAVFSTQEGGVYLAVQQQKTGMIVGITIGVLALVAVAVVGAVVYFRKNPESLSNVSRSFQNKV